MDIAAKFRSWRSRLFGPALAVALGVLGIGAPFVAQAEQDGNWNPDADAAAQQIAKPAPAPATVTQQQARNPVVYQPQDRLLTGHFDNGKKVQLSGSRRLVDEDGFSYDVPRVVTVTWDSINEKLLKERGNNDQEIAAMKAGNLGRRVLLMKDGNTYMQTVVPADDRMKTILDMTAKTPKEKAALRKELDRHHKAVATGKSTITPRDIARAERLQTRNIATANDPIKIVEASGHGGGGFAVIGHAHNAVTLQNTAGINLTLTNAGNSLVAVTGSHTGTLNLGNGRFDCNDNTAHAAASAEAKIRIQTGENIHNAILVGAPVLGLTPPPQVQVYYINNQAAEHRTIERVVEKQIVQKPVVKEASHHRRAAKQQPCAKARPHPHHAKPAAKPAPVKLHVAPPAKPPVVKRMVEKAKCVAADCCKEIARLTEQVLAQTRQLQQLSEEIKKLNENNRADNTTRAATPAVVPPASGAGKDGVPVAKPVEVAPVVAPTSPAAEEATPPASLEEGKGTDPAKTKPETSMNAPLRNLQQMAKAYSAGKIGRREYDESLAAFVQAAKEPKRNPGNGRYAVRAQNSLRFG